MTIRTHNCGELNNNHIDKTVQLSGWVNSIRTHGQIIFIDIRDRFGKTQVILSSDELIEIGKKSFTALGGKSFGRIDIKMNHLGEAHFMEANLMPGLRKGYFYRSCKLNLNINTLSC